MWKQTETGFIYFISSPLIRCDRRVSVGMPRGRGAERVRKKANKNNRRTFFYGLKRNFSIL